MKKINKIIMIVISTILMSSCNTEYLDPNSVLGPDVQSSTENLTRLINGMGMRWSTDRGGILYTDVSVAGLSTNELRLLNPGNNFENELILGGGAVSDKNSILISLWRNALITRNEAYTVINSVNDLSSVDAQTGNTLKAYAYFYVALANGTLIQKFEQVPLTSEPNAPFSTRAQVLSACIADLNTAKSLMASGLSSSITANIVGGIDLQNSVNALLARYALMAGNYPLAITSASGVSQSAKSTWQFDASVPNILAFLFASKNVTQAKNQQFGLPASLAPDSNDKRIPFYVKIVDPTAAAPDYLVEGFWSSNTSPIPIYLPGEMLLIKAEAYARQGNLPLAVAELNKVLTKKPASDAFGVGADLPAYAGAMDKTSILNEIYRNRRIELYLTGLSLEDSRRFERPGPGTTAAERNRNYYPYPDVERANNTSTPDNPAN